MLDAIEELVDERVALELAAASSNGTGTPWLSLDSAADHVGLSKRTLERAIARGQLQTSTIGRRRLLHRDALDAYVRAAGEE